MHQHNDQTENQTSVHNHDCGNLFGCGDEKGTGVVREDIKDAAFGKRANDRLLHRDEIDQERLDSFLTARGHLRRQLLRASSFMGALAAVGPRFGKLAQAAEGGDTTPGAGRPGGNGRVHVVESNKETVRLGVFDANLLPIVTIESGDAISFPNTWSHFMNELQPGVPLSRLAELRTSNPGRGPHSIIGPIAVKDAEPGDVVEIRYRRLHPVIWGAVFNNPAALGTGLLPQDFSQGQIKYVDLDLTRMEGRFATDITIPLTPFQGTLGLAPPDGFFPPLSPGVTSSVPPGPHGGNLDLRELAEGSVLYLPVWKPGALIYTGDSHAVQGDGEISLTALETAMQEVLIQVVLHKQKNFRWPVAETATHWITVGLDKDLNTAMTLAARNAIEFLSTRAKLTPHDAYALCSIAASFRVTQVVDIVRGVHAMIPKSLFTGELRRQIAVV
jgi:acetamidase/formamidase